MMANQPQMLPGYFPNEPIFTNLFKNAKEIKRPIIYDPWAGINATYDQLLGDIVGMQYLMKEMLPETAFDNDLGFIQESTPYVLVLSPGNYNYFVASFSILSYGGAMAAISTKLSPEEICYFLEMTKATCIMADPAYLKLAKKAQEYATSQGFNVTILAINSHHDLRSFSPKARHDFGIKQELTIPSDRPGILIFTSGTSGPPKGVAHMRRLLYDAHTGYEKDDTMLHHTPIQWFSAMMSAMSSVLSGSRIEFITSTAQAICERLSEGGITFMSAPPRTWHKLKQYYEDHINGLPAEERNKFIRGAQSLRFASSGGSLVSLALLRFWRNEIGVQFRVGYGLTEVGRLMKSVGNVDPGVEGLLGRPKPGVTVKLSNGDQGEILVKKEVIFLHYLNNPEKTAAAFDSDGWFKTGDVARRLGDDYIIEGRAAVDFASYRGFKIPILHVEASLLQLPFVADGCILAVESGLVGKRVAALIQLRGPEKLLTGEDTSQSNSRGNSRLKSLRKHLGASLPVFMLPTLLRILKDGEEVPRGETSKVRRVEGVEKYFRCSEDFEFDANVETWDHDNDQDDMAPKPWDWAGIEDI